MGNCLVTKLKARIEDDSLLKLNALTLLPDYAESTYGVFSIATTDVNNHLDITVTRGGSTLKRGGTSYDTATDLGQNTQIYDTDYRQFYCTPGQNAVVDIKDVHNIKKLEVKLDSDKSKNNMLINNREVLRYMTNLEYIVFRKASDSAKNIVSLIKDLPKINTLIFSVGELGIYGDLSDFAPLASKLTSLAIPQCTNIKGNIEDLGCMYKLESLTFYSNLNIHGTIEGFVQEQRRARVAAGLSAANAVGINLVYFHSTDVKFGDEFISLGDTPTLTWTDSTITLSNNKGYSKNVNA